MTGNEKGGESKRLPTFRDSFTAASRINAMLFTEERQNKPDALRAYHSFMQTVEKRYHRTVRDTQEFQDSRIPQDLFDELFLAYSVYAELYRKTTGGKLLEPIPGYEIPQQPEAVKAATPKAKQEELRLIVPLVSKRELSLVRHLTESIARRAKAG